MGRQTLFGDSDDLAGPRDPAPAWLVDELVACGVPRAAAEGYELRQAYAVRASVKKEREARERSRDHGPDHVTTDRGATSPERLAAADTLEGLLAEDPPAGADDVYRVVRASLYALSRAELARVAAGLIKLMRVLP